MARSTHRPLCERWLTIMKRDTRHGSGRSLWSGRDFIGGFRRQLVDSIGEEALAHMQAFTKWVPRPGRMTRELWSAISIDRYVAWAPRY